MSKKNKHGRVTDSKGEVESDRTRPELVRRRMNRQSTFKMGRTIGEKRERLETANERTAARKKDKQHKIRRVALTTIGFAIMIGILVFLCFFFVGSGEPTPTAKPQEEPISTEPTIEIIDEDASSGSHITNRMKSYIGQAEQDFHDLGYKAIKAVVPTGAIREVDFYLEDHPGFIKTTIDRGTAVTVEDADRMIRYLAGQGISSYEYIDVRISGKAYWK